MMFVRMSSLLLLISFLIFKYEVSFAQRNCTCVKYYLCPNSSLNVHGSGIIDRRDVIPILEDRIATDKMCKDDPLAVCCPNILNINVENRNEIKIPSTFHAPEIQEHFPWTLILLKRVDGEYLYKGEATLIHPKIALTLAHFIDDDVHINKLYINSTIMSGYERRINKNYIHNRYDPLTMIFDVAILYWTKEYVINDKIYCIKIPMKKFNTKDCMTKSRETQEVVEMTLETKKVCEKQLKNTKMEENFLLDRTFICAQSVACTRCSVTSELVCTSKKQNNVYVLIGLFSWEYNINNNLETGYQMPKIYTNIPVLSKWIKKNLATFCDIYLKQLMK